MCILINENPFTFKNLQSMALENNLNEISIGMSNDYVQAINFNPTYIRFQYFLVKKLKQEIIIHTILKTNRNRANIKKCFEI